MKKKTVKPVKLSKKALAEEIKNIETLKEQYFAEFRRHLDEAEVARRKYVDYAYKLHLLRENS